MYFIINLFKRFTHSPAITGTTLGRWSIDYSYRTINKKIDQSNEDHCGPCGKVNKNTVLREIDEFYFL